MNVFLNFRQPAPTVVPIVLLLASYPIGKVMAFVLPITVYRMAAWVPIVGGASFSFNPGPWNIKEHVLVYMMGNVALSFPYALYEVVVAETYYNVKLGYWFALVLLLATQLTGFGLAGLCRRFLVWPASMVWPTQLVACTLLNTLHAEDDEDSGGMTRHRYFMWAFLGAFFFWILPGTSRTAKLPRRALTIPDAGYLFMALSAFSWICWIVPNNIVVNQLFGTTTGLGMSFLTFDWTNIAWIGSPLMVPWWAQMHIFGGFVFFYWLIVPILYYTDTWSLSHFPMFSNSPFDKYGKPYNISRVVTSDQRLDVAAYEEYSPLYLPATYVMTYLVAFMMSTCVIVHTVLFHGRSLVNGVKRIRLEKDDIHAKLMRNYPEVPDWWYALAFTLFFSLAIVACEVWHTGVPVWALLLSVLLPCVYVVPSGFIYAMTGQGVRRFFLIFP
jgi:OPT family small oligopeptide transporter